MKDDQILDLYWNRDEQAIVETQQQYHRYCYSIALNILGNKEDADECVNDTWMKAWKAIPPQRPEKLSLFLGKISRNTAFDKFKAGKTKKRGGGEIALVLEELDECVPSSSDVEQAVIGETLDQVINQFLHTLPERECSIFLSRYWYAKSISEISEKFSMKENNVKASLFRSRLKLKTHLEREGIIL